MISFSADVMMGCAADLAEERGDLADLPQLGGYVARLRARPAHRSAQELAAPQAVERTGERR